MKEGIVYLLVDWGSNPERHKIGISKENVEKRISQLQTGCPNQLVLLNKYESKNYKRLEHFFHKKYNKYSTDGGKEWFELPNDVVINFISECEKLDLVFKTMVDLDNPFIT
jgi:hypothetical protein